MCSGSSTIKGCKEMSISRSFVFHFLLWKRILCIHDLTLDQVSQNDYEKEFELMVDSEMDGENDWWRLGVDQAFFKLELGVNQVFLLFWKIDFIFCGRLFI